MTINESLTYVCNAGDTFDRIALRMYGDEKYAYVLLAANPDLCHILMMTGGETLTVPPIERPADAEDSDAEGQTAPPWKQEG